MPSHVHPNARHPVVGHVRLHRHGLEIRDLVHNNGAAGGHSRIVGGSRELFARDLLVDCQNVLNGSVRLRTRNGHLHTLFGRDLG